MNIISTRIRPSRVHRFSIAIVNIFSRSMSSPDAFSPLSSPLRELVVGSAQQDQQQLGASEKDQADIAQWVEKVAKVDFVKPDALQVCHIRRTLSTLFIRFPVARRAPCTAHVPRQQLSDGRRRRCLW